jgi:hypothetical protein
MESARSAINSVVFRYCVSNPNPTIHVKHLPRDLGGLATAEAADHVGDVCGLADGTALAETLETF